MTSARGSDGAGKEPDLRVWYDDFELRIGDSLRRKIDQGIANSRFGIVVLSPSFIANGWPAYELDGLVTRSVDGSHGRRRWSVRCCRPERVCAAVRRDGALATLPVG